MTCFAANQRSWLQRVIMRRRRISRRHQELDPGIYSQIVPPPGLDVSTQDASHFKCNVLNISNLLASGFICYAIISWVQGWPPLLLAPSNRFRVTSVSPRDILGGADRRNG
jgi:hypothetical protein